MTTTTLVIIIAAVAVAIAVVAIVMVRRSKGPLKVDRVLDKNVDQIKNPPKHQKEKVSADDTNRSITKGRTNIFGGIAVVILGVLAVRAWSMQVLEGSKYSSEAESNMTSNVSIQARRGRLLDRKGRELVTNRASRTVVGKADLANEPKVVRRLSLVLGIPDRAIRARLMDTNAGTQSDRTIASDVSMRAISFIKENPTVFPGVSVETKTTRSYTYGTVGAHVLGYTGVISQEELQNQAQGSNYESGDVVGKAGAEAAFENLLQGTKGTKSYKVDSQGNVLGVVGEIDPDDGNDVELTIDLDVQQAAETALADALATSRRSGHTEANCGAIVAIDVKTGGIVAMASAPSFNPNDFVGGISAEMWDSMNSDDSGYPMTNRAISGQYPAASTYKAFTGLAGLSYGLIDANTSYACGGTWTGFGSDYPKKCWNLNGHGYENIYRAIADSCDIYFYDVAKDFYNTDDAHPDALQNYLRSWGFGSNTGIDISGELPGRVPDAAWKKERYGDTQDGIWVPGDLANMVIGQGDVLVSPIQMAVGYAGLATGKLLKPHVLYQVLNSNGQVVIPETVTNSDFAPEFTEQNIQIIRDALRLVVTNGGATSVFSGFPVAVAAKSGTGEAGGNRDDYAWFCAYAPFDDPQYAVSCVLERGGGGTSMAGPPVRKVLAQLMGVSGDTATSVADTGDR